MKIFCIGRNYAEHAKELNNALPTEPLVFMKPSTALLKDKSPFFYPSFSDDIHYELEIVIKINKNGKSIPAEFAKDYIGAIGLGIDFTARDIQDNLKKKGHPWELAKGFDHSAVLGDFIPAEGVDLSDISFTLERNDTILQVGHSKDMIFNFETLIVYMSRYFTLQQGDLIYTGTPAGVGPINIGDEYKGYLNGQLLLECKIK